MCDMYCLITNAIDTSLLADYINFPDTLAEPSFTVTFNCMKAHSGWQLLYV